MRESAIEDCQPRVGGPGGAETPESRLRAQVETLDRRLRKGDQQRRAMLHIMGDLNESNKRLTNHRKAMLHILADYEQDRRRLARQTERLDNSRRALLHILQDSHKDKLRLEASRQAMQQVRKANEIISHLRTFGRVASVSHEPVSLRQVIEGALSLMQEQLRLREIGITVDLGSEEPVVVGNAIQLEQVFINLLTNARDAVAESPCKTIRISGSLSPEGVEVAFTDSGEGIPPGVERRIFDPFFTTKEVGKGTGLGLSITYGIIKEHGGTISVVSPPGEGATFLIHLPLASADAKEAFPQ